MFLTVRHPAPAAIFTCKCCSQQCSALFLTACVSAAMVLALLSLAFTALALTQPWIEAKGVPVLMMSQAFGLHV
jgi:hypothetical protein